MQVRILSSDLMPRLWNSDLKEDEKSHLKNTLLGVVFKPSFTALHCKYLSQGRIAFYKSTNFVLLLFKESEDWHQILCRIDFPNR